MKGFVVGLIVLGGIALVGGAAVLAYGIHKGKINDGFVTNEYVLEEDADNISIDVSTANVHFEKAEDDKIKVVCTEKEKVYHSVSVSNKLLTIKQIDERKWYQKYLFNFNWRSMDIAVYLPETDYSDVTIDTNTGNISIPKDFTLANMALESDTGNMTINSKASGDIDIKVHTGNVRLTDVDGNSLKFKSSTGNLNCKNAEIKGAIDCTSSTGDLRFENVKALSSKSNTSTGDVIIVNTVVDTHMEVKTSTGAVVFTKSDAETMDIRTDTGSIKGTLLTSKMFDVSSDVGKPKLPPVSEWSGGVCKIDTDTGSIDISIA